MGGKITIDDNALWGIIQRSPVCNRLVKDRAQEIIQEAKIIFSASQRWDNEFRLSETTPPKYLTSFKLRKIHRVRGFAWRIINTDPGAIWVEYGAHAGGKTRVLRYRPMGRALDVVAARHRGR